MTHTHTHEQCSGPVHKCVHACPHEHVQEVTKNKSESTCRSKTTLDIVNLRRLNGHHTEHAVRLDNRRQDSDHLTKCRRMNKGRPQIARKNEEPLEDVRKRKLRGRHARFPCELKAKTPSALDPTGAGEDVGGSDRRERYLE